MVFDYVNREEYERRLQALRNEVDLAIAEIDRETVINSEWILPLITYNRGGPIQGNRERQNTTTTQNQDTLDQLAQAMNVRREDLARIFGSQVMAQYLDNEFPPDRFRRGYIAAGYVFAGRNVLDSMREATLDEMLGAFIRGRRQVRI